MELLYTRAIESRALLTFATAKSKHALLLIRICYKSLRLLKVLLFQLA